MLGKSSSELDGQRLEVASYKGEEDQSGAFQKYIAKLKVGGDEITVSFHNTTNKVQVQGQQESVKKFTEMLLIPYFQRNSQ